MPPPQRVGDPRALLAARLLAAAAPIVTAFVQVFLKQYMHRLLQQRNAYLKAQLDVL